RRPRRARCTRGSSGASTSRCSGDADGHADRANAAPPLLRSGPGGLGFRSKHPRCCDMTKVRVVEHLDKATIDAILAPLNAYTREQGFAYTPVGLALVLEDAGAIRGGLVADTAWRWMYIRLLSVEDGLRGTGFGRRLMERAEAIARDRGFIGAWVDTYSFQAPGFYRKLGYEEFGRLDDYPPGQARIFLRKAL